MASKTLLAYLAVLCFLQYSLAEARTASQMSRRNIVRRDTVAVEDLKSRSQELKARMGDVIERVESKVEERSEVIAHELQNVFGRMIDAGTKMLVERMEAEAAKKSQAKPSQ